MKKSAALLVLTLALAGCQRRSDQGPVVVSAIGGKPALADPSRKPLDTPSRMLMNATAQGLVRFDASGQIEPGLAERWIVIDDGMSYIFRLRDAEWSDGKPVMAAQVVAVLRRQIGARSHNALAPFLSAIDAVVEMTPEVIEVQLKRPRPDLLRLFAQPELAVFETKPPGGSGPFRVDHVDRPGLLLRPAFDPARAGDDDAAEPAPEQNVQLIGERAALAITRFQQRQSDFVAGGTFADWPLVAAADLPPANLRLDPAAGLFGLAIVERGGFLAEPQHRAALAQVIDRDALIAALAPGWETADRILPGKLDSAFASPTPAWAATPLDQRRGAARTLVTAWQADHPEPIHLRIALPNGPGATILYGVVGAALMSIGIEPERVPLESSADLRLIDAVAPIDSARWYLATACALCSDDAVAALETAREAPTLAARAQALAAADTALTDDAPFIPLARPLRWSLVAARLTRWQANERAWHPLNHLRNDTN